MCKRKIPRSKDRGTVLCPAACRQTALSQGEALLWDDTEQRSGHDGTEIRSFEI